MEDKSKPKKRKLKNAETFRQQIVNREQSKSDKKHRRIIRPFLVKLFSPLAKLKKELTKYTFFKIIFKIFYIISLIIYPRYIRNSFKELKGVTWPNFKLSIKLTYAVFIFAIIFGACVALLDYGFGKLFKIILLK